MDEFVVAMHNIELRSEADYSHFLFLLSEPVETARHGAVPQER